MNKKQLICLIIAAILFVFISASSVLVNSITNSDSSILSSYSASSVIDLPVSDYIGVVNVSGTIMSGDSNGGLFNEAQSYDHSFTLNYIDEMKISANNKGILLVIDSPGGTVYESDELYLKLKEYKEITDRPIWTYMKSYACSGGYYISMASDKIFANRNTWTGSIGVIISTYNLKELYDKIGIKEINITSGTNKAMGSAGETLTEEQYAIYQSIIDESYNQFVSIVSEGRNIPIEDVKKFADGRIYTAKQALELNMIDGIADTLEAFEDMMSSEISPNEHLYFYTPNQPRDFLSELFGKINSITPKSDMTIIKEIAEKKGNEVPMYYVR